MERGLVLQLDIFSGREILRILRVLGRFERAARDLTHRFALRAHRLRELLLTTPVCGELLIFPELAIRHTQGALVDPGAWRTPFA